MIHPQHIHNLKEVLYISFFWVALTLLYVFIKFQDIPEDHLSMIYGNPHLSKLRLYAISILVATPLGLVLGYLHTFFYPRLYREKSFKLNLLIRSGVLLMFFTMAIAIVSLNDNSVWTNSENSPLASIVVYMIVAENVVGILILLRRSLGINYFLNTLTNTYRNPKEEQRVVMFLDMENSTPMVEKLGHLNFSKFLQDCFLSLSELVVVHGGEVYQFVGDEAVITWKTSKKLNCIKCIDLYFAFSSRLKLNDEMYKIKYGFSPAFRCAIHSGIVSAALVGDYKKEIAYHGEVLHLCSRLQSVCKTYDAHVLISEEFNRSLPSQNIYRTEQISLGLLKGIRAPQVAYKVVLNNSITNLKSI